MSKLLCDTILSKLRWIHFLILRYAPFGSHSPRGFTVILFWVSGCSGCACRTVAHRRIGLFVCVINFGSSVPMVFADHVIACLDQFILILQQRL